MASLAKATPTVMIDGVAEVVHDGVIALSSCAAFDTQTAIQVAIEVICTFGAADLGATLYLWGSTDGTNYSSKYIASYSVILEASATTRQIFSVPHAPRYLKCTFKNEDGTDSITNVTVQAQAQTWA